MAGTYYDIFGRKSKNHFIEIALFLDLIRQIEEFLTYYSLFVLFYPKILNGCKVMAVSSLREIQVD